MHKNVQLLVESNGNILIGIYELKAENKLQTQKKMGDMSIALQFYENFIKLEMELHESNQLYTYNHFWGSNHGVLLYSGNRKNGTWMNYADSIYKLQCKLLFLDILNRYGKLNRRLDITNEIGLP